MLVVKNCVKESTGRNCRKPHVVRYVGISLQRSVEWLYNLAWDIDLEYYRFRTLGMEL